MNNLIRNRNAYHDKIFLILFSALLLLLSANKASAALIITDVDEYTDIGQLFIDVNNNGTDDMFFNVYKDSEEDSAVVQSTSSPEFSENFSGNRLNFAMSTSFDANRFAVGDVVGSNWGTWYEYAQIYIDYYNDLTDTIDKEGEWQNIGDIGFLGFSFEEDDGIHYGWMELTRGSVSISRIAYQTVAGVGASIMGSPSTHVPEPTTQMLLFSGVMFLALRRKFQYKL